MESLVNRLAFPLLMGVLDYCAVKWGIPLRFMNDKALHRLHEWPRSYVWLARQPPTTPDLPYSLVRIVH